MDDKCDSSALNAAIQFHSHSVLVDRASPQSSANEHADSPMRKRPRLDSVSAGEESAPPTRPPAARSTTDGASAHSPSDASSASLEPPATSAANTPNRVTLNLRSAKSTSNAKSPHYVVEQTFESDIAFAARSECGQDLAISRSPEPDNSMDLTADSSPSSPASPPVVEIDADDLGDINDDDYTVSDVTNFGLNDELKIFHEFPFAGDHSPTEAANMFAATMGGKDPIDPEWLLQIGEWIENWLRLARTHQARCQALYLSDSQFWHSIASIYNKFLNRRMGFGNQILRSVDGSRFRTLQRFFHPYINLVQDIIRTDLKCLRRLGNEAEDPAEYHATRHLKNLDLLFRPHPEETPLWRTLIHAQVNVEQLQENWAVMILETELPLMHDLAELTKLLSQSAQPSVAWIHAISLCGKSFQHLLGLMCTHRKPFGSEDTPLAYKRLTLEATNLAQILQEHLMDDLNKQVATMPVETIVLLSATIADILRSVATIDCSAVEKIHPQSEEDVKNMLRHEVPRHLREHIFKNLLWKCVEKGRMELRVQAVMSISAALVQLWKDYHERSNNLQPILQAASRWLKAHNVLEYLIGVDSHPQLISRGKDIIGFLFVTNCWTWEMTDFFWSTMTSHQDRRIVAAAIEVLNGILSLAHPPQIYDFCKKLHDVPVQVWGPEIRAFMRSLLDDYSWAQSIEGQRTASALCIHVLQQTATHISQASADPEISKLHALAFELLALLSQRSSNQVERERLYQSCLEDVKTCTESSLGSVEAILAISDAHKVDDLPILIRDEDLCPILAQEICLMAEHNSQRSLPERSFTGISSYLTLFSTLVTHLPISLLPEGLESNLWDHLIGKRASDDVLRDDSWNFLREYVSKSESRRSNFVDRLLGVYVPSLPPHLFSIGSLKFLEAAIHYSRRNTNLIISEDSDIVQIPLANLLWEMILDGPNETIADYCTALLSQHYLDTLLFHKVPRSSAAATHADLINRCVAQLQLAVSTNKSQTSKMADVSLSSRDEFKNAQQEIASGIYHAQTNDQRFVRTLHFMQKFLADVKSRPDFQYTALEAKAKSPLPEMLDYEAKNARLVLKYQAFTSGKQQSIKELNLSTSSTFADLADNLRAVTGFGEIAVINSGRPLDLTQEPNQLATTLSSKGLLIVRNISKTTESISTHLNISTAAERAVFYHFDTLYDFLDLPEKLSTPVYHFMNNFPPHQIIHDTVLQDTFAMQKLFPAHRHSRRRTLYSLRSLHRCLCDQLCSGNTEEKYILHGIRLLSTAFVNYDFCSSYLNAPVDQEVASMLTDCFLSFLKERPVQHMSLSYFSDESKLVDRLYALLQTARSEPSSMLATESWLMYATLVEAAFHSRHVWEVIQTKDNNLDLHYWLLVTNPFEEARDKVRICIEGACSNPSSSVAISREEFASFYWSLLKIMIGKSVQHPTQSSQILSISIAIFSSHGATIADQPTLKTYLDAWTALLTEHTYCQVPGQERVDEWLLGMSRMVAVCVSYLKSFKQPVSDTRLTALLFDKYLFPPLSDELDQQCHEPHMVPVLDDLTRKEIYSLILSLLEDMESHTWLIQRISKILVRESQSDLGVWNIDRTRWFRAPTGYSGLRNLTNTCYMNSLISQLFMNANFRAFMIQSGSAPTTLLLNRELLLETQILFANMQNANSKFADTSAFAHSIKPYDSDRIDVTVQMDVDEFYNLLFDRWESQMPSIEAKRKFRSFYGGQLVTQIKSADCDHVSERLEPFFAIQCDVKGKTSLTDSLRAYVEGDAMEGDNKYKCEACGGRLVNAIKRSCLSDLPDNLIFHLKRFDFDLATLQRSKINDEFHFPDEIDMVPYHIDQLRAPERNMPADVFELRGVLVHNGTAETGHYYSYIRLPHSSEIPVRWVEFNDTEVAEFDRSKIPDQCFGGVWIQPGTEQLFPKSHNAYMLFYQRKSANQTIDDAPSDRLSLGPVISPVQSVLADEILLSNELLIRRFCLFGAPHAQFIKSLIPAIKNLRSGNCSDDHRLETLSVSVVMQHLALVFARVKDVPDFEAIVRSVKRTSSSCGTCSTLVLNWIISRPEITHSLLLQSPNVKVRTVWSEMIVGTLQDLRRHDAQLYGIDTAIDNTAFPTVLSRTGIFHQVLQLLYVPFPTLWKFTRAWDEYFSVCSSIAELGLSELGALLGEGVFCNSLELLLYDRDNRFTPVINVEHNAENIHHLSRTKRPPPLSGLVKFIHTAMVYVDPFVQAQTDSSVHVRRFDINLQKFAPLDVEQNAIVYVDRETNQLPFIVRVMEAMEQDISSDAWYPGEIVALILNANPPEEIITRLSQTICTSFKEWLPAFSGFIFKTALYFCQRCPSLEEGISVIRAASHNAIQMLKHAELKHNVLGFVTDYSGQGGQQHLAFFRGVAEMVTPACSNSDVEQYPLKEVTLSLAPSWAPPLLLFDERDVRESACDLLYQLIFAHYPTHLDELGPQSLDFTRTDAVRTMFDRCYNNLLQAEKLRMPRTVVKPTLSVMERCAVWLHQLRLDTTASHLRSTDDEKLVQRYHDAKYRVEAWRDEDGEVFSETEWASHFDEDSSDEFTET